MRLRLAERADRGASAIEYAGLIVLAALIVGALVPLIPGRIGETLPRALCQILNITDGKACQGTAPGRPKTDINPQWCLSSSHSDASHTGISWMFFGVGQGYKVIRYDSREEDFDGKVKHYVYLSFVDSADVGISWDKAKGRKKIDLGGGLTVNYGDMYRLTPEQAKELTDKISEYQTEQYSERHSGNPMTFVSHWIYHKIKGDDWPPKIPDPAITFSEHTEGGKGEGQIPINLDKKLEAPEKYLVPNGGTASTSQDHTVTTEHWYIYKDPQGKILPATATYHTISGSYTFGANRTAGKNAESGRGGEAKGDASRTLDYVNTTRITRDDKTGKLRNIRYVVTYGDKGSLSGGFGLNGKNRGKGKKSAGLGYSNTHSNGKLHTEVIQINFDLNNPQEQQTGENWLKNHGLEMPPTVANQMFSKTGRVPGVPGTNFPLTPGNKQAAAAPPADADPFEKLIYDKGMGWKTDADTKEKAQELNATLPFGRGVGIDMSLSSKDERTKKAWILDAPGSDGTRQWIDYPDCTAAGNH